MHLCVDCALMAVPNFAVGGKEADELFLRIQHFATVTLPGRGLGCILRSDIEEFLWSRNLGPSQREISAFLSISGLDGSYSANDLLRLYNQILSSSARFPDDNSISSSDFAIEPDLPSSLTPVALLERTAQNLIITAVSVSTSRLPVMTSPFANDNTVEYAVKSDSGERKLVNSVITIPRLTGLVCYADAIRKGATDGEGLAVAISLKVMEMGGKAHGSNRFGFAEGFIESLADWNALGEGKNASNVFGILCSLVMGTCTHDQHEYGVAQPLIRGCDGARGYRLHVTKRHEALRLMFWLKGGYVEFANLDQKSVVRILGEEHSASVVFDPNSLWGP